jgi:hypothetical protein
LIDQDCADEAIRNLEPIAVYSQLLAVEAKTHKAAVHFCTFALDILENIAQGGHRHPSAPALVAVFTETLGRMPPSWESGARKAGKKASDLISADQAAQAEAVCRPYLAPLQYGSNLQLEIHRLLIEALLYQQKWDEAGEEVSAIAARLGANPIHRRTAEELLHNAGLLLASWALLAKHKQASDMFSQLMSETCFMSVRNSPSTPNSGKFAILNLSLAVIQNSGPDITRYMPAVKSAMTSDTWVTENPPFMMLAVGATAAAAAL